MTTTTGPSTTLSTAVEQTWAKLRAVRDQIRDLKAQEADLASALRTELGRGEFVPSDGGPTLAIYATKRFDPELAAMILPKARLPEVQRVVVDGALVKEKLPELYPMCQVEKDKDTVKALP